MRCGDFSTAKHLVARKLIYDRLFPAAYDLTDVSHDVFSIFLLNQVLIFDKIGDPLLNGSP